MQREHTSRLRQLQFPIGWAEYGDQRVPARLWAKVEPDPETGCWVWTGGRFGSRYEYGAAWWQGQTLTAHRVFYALLVRAPRDDEHVHHEHCRNTLCVNPAHTAAIPKQDHWGHGHADKTHCPRGHEYTPENTKVCWRLLKSGRLGPNRQCKTCKRAKTTKAR